jgi:hypothetical protein
MKKPNKFNKTSNEQLDKNHGHPKHPGKDDIYNKFNKEFDIDPENIAKEKHIINIDRKPTWNEKSFEQDKSGSDLDIPGSELDDVQENIGSEDEENNRYSIDGERRRQ